MPRVRIGGLSGNVAGIGVGVVDYWPGLFAASPSKQAGSDSPKPRGQEGCSRAERRKHPAAFRHGGRALPGNYNLLKRERFWTAAPASIGYFGRGSRLCFCGTSGQAISPIFLILRLCIARRSGFPFLSLALLVCRSAWLGQSPGANARLLTLLLRR